MNRHSVGDRVIVRFPQCADREATVQAVLAGGKTLAVRFDTDEPRMPDLYVTADSVR